jgi:hypothetical protein
MLDCMRTVLAGILISLAVLFLVAQLALPPFLEGRVGDRLEELGGTAEVHVDAVPALALLAGRGGTFRARGTGLRFDLGDRRENPFKRLDGFEHVDMKLRDLDAGPLNVERFELSRDARHDPYELRVSATTTPRELSAGLGGTAAGALGGLIGSLAAGVLPGAGSAPIPVELDALVDSSDGKPKVTSAHGTVAGFPAGPLAEIVLGTVLDRL